MKINNTYTYTKESLQTHCSIHQVTTHQQYMSMWHDTCATSKEYTSVHVFGHVNHQVNKLVVPRGLPCKHSTQ